MIFFAVLFPLFFIHAAGEGAGFTTYFFLFLWTSLSIPTILYLYILFTQPSVRIPYRLTALAMLFFLFSGISAVFFSQDKQSSVELLLLYFALFLIFLFSYNNKNHVKKVMWPLLFTLGLFFSAYSLIFHNAIHEKQVVFPIYGSHNHLGDYLGILLTMLIVTKVWKTKPILVILGVFFFILMLMSFSRSAYFGLIIITVIFFIRSYRILPRSFLIVGAGTLCILLVSFYIVSSREISHTSPLYAAQQYVVHNFGLYPRDILSLRNDLFSQSITSIKKYPVFGIGGGNFIKASKILGFYENYSDSAHNFLLEIAVEQGLPALLCSLLIVFTLIFRSFRRMDVWSYVAIYLILNFLTDYTYKMYFFLIIAALVFGISYKEKKSYHIPVWLYGITSLVLFFMAFLMFTSNFFLLLKKPLKALYWYPLNKTALIQAIQNESKNDVSNELIRRANLIAPENAGIMFAIAQNHLNRNQKSQALTVFEKMYKLNRLISLSIVEQIVLLKQELYGKRQAVNFLINVAGGYKNRPPMGNLKEKFAELCIKYRGQICWETEWYGE